MSILTSIRKVAGSKPARTFFWLLVSIVCCVAIVMLLSTHHPLQEHFDVDLSTVILEFTPKPSKGSLIYYKYKDESSYMKWVDKINQFWIPYNTSRASHIECNYDQYPSGNETCWVDYNVYKPCLHWVDFGYPKASPCVFIKFKKILDWVPEYYDMETIRNKNIMNQTGLSADPFYGYVHGFASFREENLKTIWITCEGVKQFDKTLLGDVEYHPVRGFPGYFFPYRGQDGYLEPLVAVQFVNPRRGIVIDIICKVVARNFTESFRFTLMVDDDEPEE